MLETHTYLIDIHICFFVEIFELKFLKVYIEMLDYMF